MAEPSPDNSQDADDDLIQKIWAPIFPAEHKLIPLATDNTELRDTLAPYDKQNLLREQRAIDGWSKGTERHQLHVRQTLISDILSRWWFVFPIWPPKDFDYKHELQKRGYREVKIKDWPTTKEEEDGLKKVYQLGNFEGVFRNSENKMLDMRPKSTCPCYVNLQRQPMNKLVEFVIRAYENQIECLQNQSSEPAMGEKVEKNYINELSQNLKTYKARKNDLVKGWDVNKQAKVEKFVRQL